MTRKFSGMGLIQMKAFCEEKISKLSNQINLDYSEWFDWDEDSKINICFHENAQAFKATYYQYDKEQNKVGNHIILV